MKILIVSDTHRRDENFEKVLQIEKPVDRVIHLGDAEETEAYMCQLAGQPLDKIFQADKRTMFLPFIDNVINNGTPHTFNGR